MTSYKNQGLILRIVILQVRFSSFKTAIYVPLLTFFEGKCDGSKCWRVNKSLIEVKKTKQQEIRINR